MNKTTIETTQKLGSAPRRILGHTILALAISLGWIAQASALPVNGGFETGDFTGWTTSGNTSVVGTLGEFIPPDPSNQALLSTWTDDVNSLQPVSAEELETFLGLDPNTLSNIAVEGSAIRTQFTTVLPNQTVSFQWNFLTTDPTAAFGNDFAFVSLDNVTNQLADTTYQFLLASTTSFSNHACFSCPPGTNSFATGYQSGSILIPTAGTYRLGFGVVNVDVAGELSQASALLIDSVSVPEPSTGLFLVAGLIGLVWWRRSQVASV